MNAKASDIENREFRRRSIEVFIVLLGVIGAMGFVVIVVPALFPKELQVWIIFPLFWVLGGGWCLYLWLRYRCPTCQKPMRLTMRYRCGKCGAQFEP